MTSYQPCICVAWCNHCICGAVAPVKADAIPKRTPAVTPIARVGDRITFVRDPNNKWIIVAQSTGTPGDSNDH